MARQTLFRMVLVLLLAFPLAPAIADEASKAAALELMERGRKLYRKHKFRRAIEVFERGQAIHPDPNFLYNLGKCHQRLGEDEAAIVDFVGYLIALPDANDRAEVEEAIRALGGVPPERPTRVTETSPPLPPPAPLPLATELPPEPEPPPVALEPPQPSEVEQVPEPASWKWAAWTTVGLGAASSGLGVLFLVQARSAADDANACLDRERQIAPCQDDIDRHGNRRTLAGVSLAVGVAALIGGGAWVYSLRDRDEDAEPSRVNLSVTSGEVVAQYKQSF